MRTHGYTSAHGSPGTYKRGRPRGHFVRKIARITYRPQEEWRERPDFPELDQFMDEQAELGRDPHQTIAVELVDAPPDVAARLGLASTGTVVVRKRVRYLSGVPFNTNDSYYPLNLVEGSEIMLPADIGRGANQILAELGAEQTHAVDELEIRMPSPDEAARLTNRLRPKPTIRSALPTTHNERRRAPGVVIRLSILVQGGAPGRYQRRRQRRAGHAVAGRSPRGARLRKPGTPPTEPPGPARTDTKTSIVPESAALRTSPLE